VGDGGSVHTKAQDLTNLNGKVLRININGSIPSDNPYVGQAGLRPEVWAYGFRNPWRCRFQPGTGRLLCADVGESTWEEIDLVAKGLNFGWPTTEGPFTQASFPQFTTPLYWYNHNGLRAAITGGDFGARTNFPGSYQQSYFFGDYGMGFIKQAVLDTNGTVLSVQDFATGLGVNSVTDIVAGPDGALYYTDFTTSAVWKIFAVAGNHSPVASASVNPPKGSPPLTVAFSSAGSSDPDGDPITFSWDFGDGSAPSTAANPTHTYTTRGMYTATLT